jgi:orotidine-5'-phosphate decarboxylase
MPSSPSKNHAAPASAAPVTPAQFADRLLDACRRKGAPICVGIDPVYERLPEEIRHRGPANPALDAAGASTAIRRFCEGVIEAIAPYAPVVKIQSACFERYLWPGVEALNKLIGCAHAHGLLVILDAKRGDIGISAEHYAAGLLATTTFSDLSRQPLIGPDALTVSPYLGSDTLEPFVKVAAAAGKGLFALVRTSNPGSDELQNLRLADGRDVAQAIAEMLAIAGAPYLGAYGYSLLGAVVGATKPQDAARLRKAMPAQLFLVPGFGAQGGTADDVRACFNPDKQGALITASRSVLFAYEKTSGDWRPAVAAAAADFHRQIAGLLA